MERSFVDKESALSFAWKNFILTNWYWSCYFALSIFLLKPMPHTSWIHYWQYWYLHLISFDQFSGSKKTVDIALSGKLSTFPQSDVTNLSQALDQGDETSSTKCVDFVKTPKITPSFQLFLTIWVFLPFFLAHIFSTACCQTESVLKMRLICFVV